MPLVQNKNQLIDNLVRVDWYLEYGTLEERNQMATHIAKGYNFIVYSSGGEYRFAPSKYIGYANNTLVIHRAEITAGRRHGARTTGAINAILGPHVPEPGYNAIYTAYCRGLGHDAHQNIKTFWLPPLEANLIYQDQINNPAGVGEQAGFPEGNLAERLHWVRERNPRVINQAKDAFRQAHNDRLFCQICKTDFKTEYGAPYTIIEGHHVIPINQMQPGAVTMARDIVMLCPNCHRMVHRYRPWITREQFDDFSVENFRNYQH